MRVLLWRFLAKLLGLGLLTVRPTWPEIRYKINGRIRDARRMSAIRRHQKSVEFQQYETWRFHWLADQRAMIEKRARMAKVQTRLKCLLSRHTVA